MSILPAKSNSNLRKISPTLPEQRAYSSKSRKKKEMFDLLEKIPEAQAIRDWNFTLQSKEKESKFVPDPLPSRPVIHSMFFNPLSSNEDIAVS